MTSGSPFFSAAGFRRTEVMIVTMQNHFARRSFGLAALAFAAALFGWVGVRAQQSAARAPAEQESYRKAMEAADQKIAAAEQEHSDAYQNEEYLSTYIGPRLTGSSGMQKASAWTLGLFRKYGLDAQLETTHIPHAWYRGNDWGELVSPVQHWMTVRSAAWSKATPGPVTGGLAVIGRNTTPEDIAANAAKYKGAIVLTEEPEGPAVLPKNPTNAHNANVPQPHGVPKTPPVPFPERLERMRKMMTALADAGAVAILRDSRKPDALLMTGIASFPRYEPSILPVAYLSHPDYEWLLRLAKDGQGSFRIDLTGKFSPGPVPASITVAQIKGSKYPDQQVIIGGHLDSWDLGEGSVDNGTGAMATIEAARLLHSLGWKPDRTLTFILFTGEEQGGIGVRKFLKDHAAEIPKMDAVMVDDNGAGRIISLPLENFWSTGPLLQEIYLPLQEVFGLEPMSTEFFPSSDHIEFQQAGVPAYFAVQAPAHYAYAHHTTDDVFEVVRPEALKEQAALLAAWMWNVSQMPEALPHHPAEQAR
jgi:carboxypeptidase Q